MIRALALLGVLGALVLSAPAAANDDTVVAGETFRAGEAAYARGDYEAAALSFEVSYKLAPHPNALYNAGLAWDAAGKPERAADAFAGALAMDAVSDAQRQDATTRLAAMKPDLALVRIIAPAGTTITLAHVTQGVTPAAVHLRAGDHTLEVMYSDGTKESVPVVAVPGAEMEIDLVARKPVEPPVPPTPPPPDPVTPVASTDAEWIAGWIALGLGAAGGGIAIGLGVAALGARDDFDASGHTDRGAHDRADSLRTATNVAWAAAGAFAVTGALLLIISATAGGEETAIDRGLVLRF